MNTKGFKQMLIGSYYVLCIPHILMASLYQ